MRLVKQWTGLKVAALTVGVLAFVFASAQDLRPAPPLKIKTGSLPSGTVGALYSFPMDPDGGDAPYSWTATGLPAGLSIGSSSGVISGTPGSAGSFGVTVTLRDSALSTVSKSFTLVINPAPLVITTTSLASGTVGVPYSASLAATGGVLPYSWSLMSGSLPTSFVISTGGLISGTTANAGTSTFTVRVSDSASQTTTKLLSITIIPALVITTASPLPAGKVGVAYSQPLTATGGTPPYTWSVAPATLPAGLSLSAGVIGGIPTAATTATFNVQVSDSGSQTVSKPLSITINPAPPPLVITTASPLPAGTVAVAYSQPLTATGGTPPYTWSVAPATLPAGLSLSAGVISGIPTAATTATFNVQVNDSASQTVSKSLSITINPAAPPPLVITTASPLPAGTIGAAYSQTLTASGGTPPYSWSVTSGTLPAGLTLSAAGLLSGTPTAATTVTFDIQVSDSGSQKISKSLSITINAAPVSVTITTASPLPSGTAGAAYSQTLTVTGGAAPYTWSVATGTLPAGLALSAAGVISGTPTAATTANFTVQVTDSASQTASKLISLTVNSDVLSISAASTLPTGTVGSVYSQSLAATGGAAPYTWSILSGTLPAGLLLSASGVISGTPTAISSANFTIQVTDSASQTASKLLSITINAAPISIMTGSPLPPATVGGVYSVTLGASGGVGPYSWSITAGTLTTGLTLSSSGTLSGTPKTAGTFNFTIQAVDANSVATTKVFSHTVQAVLTITTTSPLATAVVDSSYSQQLQASLADPLTWSVLSGNLPSGITLSSSGLLSGTPMATGTFDFTVQATGGTPQQIATQLFRLEVSAGFVITTAPVLPDGTALLFYTTTLNAGGGTSPYTWTLSGGNLPDGLNLSTSGLISGTATNTGVFTITVQASDASDRKAIKVFTLSIITPPLGTFSVNVPGTMNPAQQVPIGLSLSAGQPNPISGSLKISFASNSVVPADDPAVLFSNGSRTVPFTIAADSTTAVFAAPVLLLTGTVSGTVSVTADIDSGPAGLPVATVTIPPTAPKLTNIAAERTPNGLRIQITGYSPERKLSNAEFAFDVRTPAGMQHTNLVRNVEPEFDAWYRSAASTAFGSSFVFEQLFSVQGDANMIGAVTVSLTNGQGTASSTPVSIAAQ